jgi:hypothetical protein
LTSVYRVPDELRLQTYVRTRSYSEVEGVEVYDQDS